MKTMGVKVSMVNASVLNGPTVAHPTLEPVCVHISREEEVSDEEERAWTSNH